MKSHDIGGLHRIMHEGLKNYNTSKKIYFVCCKNDEVGDFIKDRKRVHFFNSILIRKNLLKLAVQKINEVQFADPDSEYEWISMGKLWSEFRQEHDRELRNLSRTLLENSP